MLKIKQKYLNTSHVKVNLEDDYADRAQIVNLNTSHVKVNLVILVTLTITMIYLNTSHVKVNPEK